MEIKPIKKIPTDLIWILVVLSMFGLVYLFSGTLVYVEGDDATSIAYHLLGRDNLLQPPIRPIMG